MSNKALNFLIVISIIISNIIITPTAQAEIVHYEGRGEFLITNETIEYAKQQAKLEAELDISRQVYTYIESHTQVNGTVLDSDEIITETESIIRIIDVKYKVVPEGEYYIVRATVQAEVDTEELDKLGIS